MDKVYLLAGLNLLACSVICFVSICRLNAITERTLYRTQFEYAVLILAALTSGFSPWFGEWPGYAQLVLDLAVLTGLLSSAHAWHYEKCDRAPPTTERGAP